MEEILLRCGRCRDRDPDGWNRLVGSAYIGSGVWWLTMSLGRHGTRRIAKGGSRLVARNVFILTPDDAPEVSEVEVIERILNRPRIPGFPVSRLAFQFSCPNGHLVGADDPEELIHWLEKARDAGLTALPLPEPNSVMVG